MPAKIKVFFKSEEPINSKELTPDRIHGLFFSILDNSIANQLHKPSRYKPFTLCCIDFFKKEKLLNKFSMEITFLNDELFSKTTTAVILKSHQRPFFLNGKELKLLRTFKVTDGDVASYEKLYEESTENLKNITLNFLTPTSFKKGKYDFLLPIPEMIFKSLIMKWNNFSTFKVNLTEMLDFIKRHIYIVGYSLNTVKIEMSSLKKITGFKGKLFLMNTYHNNDKKFVKYIDMLLQFSNFAGVGRKATMGFGKTAYTKLEGE